MVLVFEWPSIPATTLGWVPASSSRLAALCLKSWNLSAGLKVTTFSFFRSLRRALIVFSVRVARPMATTSGQKCRRSRHQRPSGGSTLNLRLVQFSEAGPSWDD